ncbi:uncharacterized protein EAF02_005961 [Botrytis sinoallii]|uniref:uncharacterized protein n=1 Tax=Botrytis sinoallii TaxID=1463999 RepID=UPI0019024674|nr:uncharacterized protein EAF02_005961 [Botrytis sinoallii]KAF7882598.1 hypothetical protein EAF02_005961 [Botrytis sinoallii]
MPSQPSRMSRSSESTTASDPSLSTPSMDIDTQLAPLPETRKRSRNLDLDSDNEESQAQRVRVGDSDSIENVDSEMAIDTPAQNVTAPPRSRQSRIRSGRHAMSRQEQEQISSTFANIGAPTTAPNLTQSAPASSPSRANHIVQASAIHQSHESTSQRRSYEDTSGYDADISGDERPRKVRRRSERQNSVHTPAVSIENRNAEAAASPTSNEASVVENQGSETALPPTSSVLLTVEAPSNQIALTPGDTPYIDLTFEDSSDEEEGDAALSPAPSVLPAVAAPPVQNPQPNANRKFVDLTFEDSSDEKEGAATMSQAYIGDRIVLVEEKRLEPFLPEPTIRFQYLLEDARTQKLHCLQEWTCVGFKDDVQFLRHLAVLGTSGNVYTVILKKKPRCNCYEGNRGILCVHIVFILTKFLHLPAPLRHQSAFLEAELRCMVGDDVDWMGPVPTGKFCPPKSVEEQGTCSICLENLEGNASMTWCMGQCGQNFHLQCIWTWADTNFMDGQPDITCGHCRAPWICEDDAEYCSLSELLDRDVSKDEYFNVAELLGDYETEEDDAEAHQSYQRAVDKWRAEMVRRPTTLTEEVNAFVERYYPKVYDDVYDEYLIRSNDGYSPSAIRALETEEI